jgi:integrase
LATHDLLGGRLHVYKRVGSDCWQCATYLNGRNHRVSSRQESLAEAKDFAEDWYLGLKGKLRSGELPAGGKPFGAAAKGFLEEVEALLADERNPNYVAAHKRRLDTHLIPFFGKTALPDVTPAQVQAYRVHRQTSRVHPRSRTHLKDPRTGRALRGPDGKLVIDPDSGEVRRPARSTLHQEIVTLRQVLKYANRQGWIPYLPDLSPPYRGSGKVSHRAWFSPEEYKQLYTATRERARHPPKPRWRTACEELHDYVLFMANTGLRPDEAARIEFRDVRILDDDDTGERILLIDVRGKRGTGYCKSMPGAVEPFRRLCARLRPRLGAGRSGRSYTLKAKDYAKPGPGDRVFAVLHSELFNTILEEQGLRTDRQGLPRTAYSLRHTYICLRLMEGADIYQLAKNCRTSVEMIQKYYAAHLASSIDAAAINVRKPAKPKTARSKAGALANA